MTLSGEELAQLRADANQLLTETVSVQRATTVSDGYGGETQTWNTVASVTGFLARAGLKPEELVIAERLTGQQVWVMLLPAGTDVRQTDRLVLGTRTFEVVAVLSGSLEVLRRVMVVKVQ